MNLLGKLAMPQSIKRWSSVIVSAVIWGRGGCADMLDAASSFTSNFTRSMKTTTQEKES